MTDDTPANPDQDKRKKTERRETLTDDLIRAEFAEVSRVRGRQRDDSSEHPPEPGTGAEDQDEQSRSDTPDQGPAHGQECPRGPNRKQQQ